MTLSKPAKSLNKVVSGVLEEGMNRGIRGRKKVPQVALPSATSEAIVLPHLIGRNLLQVALVPELTGRGIRKVQSHNPEGYWLWTLNLYCDICLAGKSAIPDALAGLILSEGLLHHSLFSCSFRETEKKISVTMHFTRKGGVTRSGTNKI